jgi:long-chain acyl-CoA synthetase
VAVGFWTLDRSSRANAIVAEDGRTLTYSALRDNSDRFAETISGSRKTLGFILCRNTPECVASYLGALRSENAVCLLDGEIHHDQLARLIAIYQPDWLFTTNEANLAEYRPHEFQGGVLHRRIAGTASEPIAGDLALLLPTSGSTGSPKLVRLSYSNLQANALSIVDYLEITSEDRAISTLPMAYSYGLSVLHTHLLVGAQMLLTNGSFLQREFWNYFHEQRPTSVSGVPYHYEVMLRMRMLDKDLPGLRALTQAGGRLAPEHISQIENIAARRSWQFFVMYGQTEATARISYVPASRLREKVGSIGVPVSGGKLSIDPETQELLYSGPNVMLGYAENRSDLAKQDECLGHLRTGDLATCDGDGYFYISGRLKRFLKIFGKRYSLDEMEDMIGSRLGRGVACFGEDDRVSVAIDRHSDEQAATRILQTALNLHPTAFRIICVDSLPRLANGKLDYQSLTKVLA